jgi:hypothetical protein
MPAIFLFLSLTFSQFVSAETCPTESVQALQQSPAYDFFRDQDNFVSYGRTSTCKTPSHETDLKWIIEKEYFVHVFYGLHGFEYTKICKAKFGLTQDNDVYVLNYKEPECFNPSLD